MKRVFGTTTLKLTAWYMLILVTISLLFSVIIFEISTSEISRRLERLQIRVEGNDETITLPGPVTLNDIRVSQTREAKASIFIGLVYTNLATIGLGGVGSYVMARRTLRPIEDAHEAQSRFTSDASHELRTPLAVMKSEIQVLLRSKKVTPHEYREVLESNLEEVDKLTQLSQSLLQLSKLEHGDTNRTERVDIRRSIEVAARSLQIPARRLNFNVADNAAATVDGNKAVLTDLFQILLDNAVKYSPDGSSVDVRLVSNGRYCTVTVTNYGEGIAEEDLPHVFDRFYRAAKSRSSRGDGGGYGLGLSLAKKIVEVHEGSISVESTPGKTTCFTVELPHVRKNR